MVVVTLYEVAMVVRMKEAPVQGSRKCRSERDGSLELGKGKEVRREVLAAHKANIPATKNTVGFAPFSRRRFLALRRERPYSFSTPSRESRLVLFFLPFSCFHPISTPTSLLLPSVSRDILRFHSPRPAISRRERTAIYLCGSKTVNRHERFAL